MGERRFYQSIILGMIGEHVTVVCLFYLDATKGSKLRGAIGRHIGSVAVSGGASAW